MTMCSFHSCSEIISGKFLPCGCNTRYRYSDIQPAEFDCEAEINRVVKSKTSAVLLTPPRTRPQTRPWPMHLPLTPPRPLPWLRPHPWNWRQTQPRPHPLPPHLLQDFFFTWITVCSTLPTLHTHAQSTL